ncbi:hypothetical protein [Pseudomonas sp. PWP3-1b2]|uniref:hypothetical protein n=1 Tax=Pseudomonas sp. PWP3-1b2 TaxID=2804656 RepID=UPI003CF648E5
MLKQNEKILIPGEEALDVLKEIEFILISLHKMGSYYAEKPGALEEYRRVTTDFIDNCAVTQRLAKVRKIISQHFDESLGDDDMDDIERYVSDLKTWKPDQPLNQTNQNTDQINISKGTIHQVTCKQNELLVVFTDEQNVMSLVTFYDPSEFKGMSALGEICEIGEDKAFNLPPTEQRSPQTKKSYFFKASDSGKVIFEVIASSYLVERI